MLSNQLLGLLAALAIFPHQHFAQLTPSPTYAPPSPTAGLVRSTGTPSAQWSNVLGNSLWFFDAQRSGRLNQGTYGNRVAWRNDSALNDGQDYGLDLTGGWYDAGDYIKATFPLVHTLFAISWSALTHGQGYSIARQTAYLDGTLRWGFDWLMRVGSPFGLGHPLELTVQAHPSDDVLFVQVGDSDIDNSYWGGDQGIATPRPSFPVNSSFPGTDVWAAASASLAMASLLYSNSTYSPFASSQQPANPSLSNTTYSSQLLDHATRLYTVANTTRQVSFATSIPAVASAYGSSGWGDDMTLAALSLALATNQSSYYADAYRWYGRYRLSGGSLVYNWDSKTPAGAGLAVNLTGWQNEAEGYFDRVINGQTSNTYRTQAGLQLWRGDSDFASLNPAMAFTMLLLKYAPMASSIDKSNQYTAFAQTQIDYVMGRNPMNSVYLVGSHPNSPKNPHSGPATGGSGFTNLRANPPQNVRTLYGALVGGPLANDLFWDWRDDWVQTEIALDYNAAIPGIAAMMLANNSADPYYVNVEADTYAIPNGQPCDAALPCGGRLPGGAIAGIVLGILAFLLLLAGLIWWRRRHAA